jgi:hypothetical protein
MSFDAAWLDLREPADHAARDAGLLARAQGFAAALSLPVIVDLGCGTGSTARAMNLPEADWLFTDHDDALLALAQKRCGGRLLNLDLRDVLALPIKGARMVTASALFDLVSADWIDAFADLATTDGTAIYAALSYDGVMSWSQPDDNDERVCRAFNRNQRGDKGFGHALGPQGASYLADAMRRRGYDVWVAASPWILGSDQAELQRRLLGGIASVAGETGCRVAEQWLDRRLAMIATSRCTVGHLDVLALPPR